MKDNQIRKLSQNLEKEFVENRLILGFDEFIAGVGKNPDKMLRGSAQVLLDALDHYGKKEITPGSGLYQFGLFELPFDGVAERLVGHEEVQTRIYETLKSFSRQGMNNRLILLHGPNGSAKSSIAQALMSGLEKYSTTPDGAQYSFSWIFPIDRIQKGGKGFGLQTAADRAGVTHAMGALSDSDLQSFAHLKEEEVAAKIPSDLRDHPFLLIPKATRLPLLTELLGEAKAHQIWDKLALYLKEGDLNPRCKQIFDALYVAYNGSLERVLQHIQVERFFFSKRYRRALVTIEPQLHVDAHAQQLTMNRSISSLPPVLHSLNLQEHSGDLVDGTRGMIEYSDLLKRPVDTFKYLLIACETGSFNVGSSTLNIDSVMIGSANELQLDAFKEFPDFGSFKARFDLIRVPLLLAATKERQIYAPVLRKIGLDKHVAPHTDWAIATWGVLTRLKKPDVEHFTAEMRPIVTKLSPLDKLKLYDTGEIPNLFSSEERKTLRANLVALKNEYGNIPYYEGRLGASARELKNLLLDVASDSENVCVSPLAIFRELNEFVKHDSEYEFLRQEVKDGYHDAKGFINILMEDYLNIIDREVRESLDLYESTKWEDFIRKYVQHLSVAIKKEKIKNMITGRMEDPDYNLMREFELIVDAPKGENDLQSFRQAIITQIGVWSLDHPNEQVVYSKVFPEYWARLEKHYYESQKAILSKMHSALKTFGMESTNSTDEGMKLANKTIGKLIEKYGYSEDSSKEIINFLMERRY
jgi:predicted Ser/Thr protein kinase